MNITTLYKVIFLTAASSLSGGCTPEFEDHYYISLEKNDKIEITKKGELPELFFNEPVPIKYRLERQNYILFFEIQRVGNAEITIKVVNKLDNGRSLRVNSISVDGNEIDGLSTEDNCVYLFTAVPLTYHTKSNWLGFT